MKSHLLRSLLLSAVLVLGAGAAHAKDSQTRKVAQESVHRCEADARAKANALLRYYLDMQVESVSIDDHVRVLPSIKSPDKRRKYEVLELIGYVYKAEYRMRFIYAQLDGIPCLMMGQEILDLSSL